LPQWSNLDRFPVLRDRLFEVRPELPTSLVSRDVWESWQEEVGLAAKPITYDVLTEIEQSPLQAFKLNGRLVIPWPFPVVMTSRYLPRVARRICPLMLGTGDTVPRGTQCLGADFLSHGLSLSEGKCIRFFDWPDGLCEISSKLAPTSKTFWTTHL